MSFDGSEGKKKMKIYVTSDTHFNHSKLVEWGRPEDFEEKLIDNHSKIEAESYLIHLGDFCIGQDEAMHEMWNDVVGHVEHRILVRGNHDKKSTSWYLEHGWHAVVDKMELKLFGRIVLFSHIPVDPKLYFAGFNVHGHTHGNSHRDIDVKDFYDLEFHREVAMENTNYRPILLTEKFLNGKRR